MVKPRAFGTCMTGLCVENISGDTLYSAEMIADEDFGDDEEGQQHSTPIQETPPITQEVVGC